MADPVCSVLNGMLCTLYRKEYQALAEAGDIKTVQLQKLHRLLRQNATSLYGREHGFGKIRSLGEFRERVPLTTYESYTPYLERICAGQQGVLTAEDVVLLEPTGGSTSGSKLIPYTKSLGEEMQRGIRPWIYNLYTSYPGVGGGRSYWSVTPAAAKESRTAGGIPIGFEDDAAYFGRWEQRLLRLLFAVPQEVARETDMERFYHRTARDLLECGQLALISVWNPTFLLLLLDYMDAHLGQLLPALSPRRRAVVARYLPVGKYGRVWPNLKVISCWCDAAAKNYARPLQNRFPGVHIQPKGLLATECFVSLPLRGQEGGVLSIHSHFFEFKSLADGGLYLAHQLRQGEEYEVIVSTGGGFYRYQIRDVVRVLGKWRGIPRLEFRGRGGRISDLYGEKLHEAFVERALGSCGVRAAFQLVAPEGDRYVLYMQGSEPPSAQVLDNALRENFHYDYCRRLGQLKELRVFRLTGEPGREYFRHCVDRGQKLGDIKPALLVTFGGWQRYFQGDFVT